MLLILKNLQNMHYAWIYSPKGQNMQTCTEKVSIFWVVKSWNEYMQSLTNVISLYKTCICMEIRALVMKKGNIWGQNSSSLVLNKGIELQHAFHIWRETIVLDMFTGSLSAQNWQVRYVAIYGHTRDIAQHICAKLHLILTVVLISRPIGQYVNISVKHKVYFST